MGIKRGTFSSVVMNSVISRGVLVSYQIELSNDKSCSWCTRPCDGAPPDVQPIMASLDKSVFLSPNLGPLSTRQLLRPPSYRLPRYYHEHP